MVRRVFTYLLLIGVMGFPAAPVLAAPKADGEQQVAADDTEPADGYKATIKAANVAYTAGNYQEAADGYVEAIQTRPQTAVPYRDLARTYFWQSQYAAAVAYYDTYLRLADEDVEDRKQVQSERRLASTRAGDEPYSLPDSQKRAQESLEDHLQQGAAYSRGGGGAWGLYQTLLRTGYAQPDLASLRRRLVRKLLDEFEGKLVAESGQPVPQLGLEDWQLQKQRLEAARKLAEDPIVVEAIERRKLLVDTSLALLNGAYQEAIASAKNAIETNPDMPFVRWLYVSALVETHQNEAALEATDELARVVSERAPQQMGYVEVLRAAILQRAGRAEEASSAYLGLIRE